MSDRGREQRRPPKGLRYVVYVGLGVVVLMMVVLSAAVFLGGKAPAGPDYPGAEFEYEYDADNATLRVELANGTEFTENDTSRLTITLDDEAVGRFSLPARRGDTVTLGGVDPGTVVRVIWYSDGDVRTQLDRTTVGTTSNETTTGS